MNRIIKLTDAKVPSSFKTEKSKRKNGKQGRKSFDVKTCKRRQHSRDNKASPNQKDTVAGPDHGPSLKRRRKGNNDDSRSDRSFQKSEVQLELEKLNTQLK